MDTLSIIVLICVFAFGCFLYVKAFRIFCFAELILEFPLKPVNALCRAVSEFFSFSSVWSFTRLLLMVGVFIWSLVYVVLAFINDGASTVILTAFNGTTLGGFTQLMQSGFSASDSINYGAMLAAGLSSFLSFIYMSFTANALTEADCHPVLYWILIPVFNVTFLFLSSILGAHLADWCTDAAGYLVSLYNQLLSIFHSETGNVLLNILKGIGTGLLLLVMLYAALVTLITVVREYFASILYGIFALAVIVVIGLVFDEWLGWSTDFVGIIFVAALIGIEYLRANQDANDAFKEFIIDLS